MYRMHNFLVVAGAVAVLMLLSPSSIRAADKVPILLDTDIGDDIDDAFALALAVASPEIDLVGVTTVAAGAEDRAWMVCRFLTAVGRREVPVAWGRDPQPAGNIERQIQYRRHPAVIFNRTAKPIKESAVEFLYAKLKEQPGKLTIVAIGPLTNIARLLKEHPDCKPWIKRLVIMGGSVRVGYDGKKPEAEWNIKSDIPAAQAVFTSGVPLVVAPLDATATLQLRGAAASQILRGLHAVNLSGAGALPIMGSTDPDPLRSGRRCSQLHRTVLHDGRPLPGGR